MSRAKDVLVALGVLIAGRGRPKLPDRERIVADAPPRPGWERVAIALFLCGALSALAFPFLYAFAKHLPHETQLFGLSIGLAFLFLGAGLVVTGKHLIVTEELEEDYPEEEHPHEQEALVQVVEESGSRLTSRRLFL